MDSDDLSRRQAGQAAGLPEIARSRTIWRVGALLGILALLLWLWLRSEALPDLSTLWRLAQDQEALERLIAQLGWFGPVALVAANMLQIVFAPIPGYVMQMAAGYLYGAWWGGVWGSLGLLSGSMLAMWLARTYGRPVVARLTGTERLERWESIAHSDSVWVWFILLLGPTGDLPYFLAGLARVHFWTIFLITLLVRVPFTFVAAAAGAGILLLAWWQMGLLIGLLFVLLLLFLRFQEQWLHWIDSHMHRRITAGGGAQPVAHGTLPAASYQDVRSPDNLLRE